MVLVQILKYVILLYFEVHLPYISDLGAYYYCYVSGEGEGGG